MDKPTDLRKQYVNETWYAKATEFTDDWDQQAFDPDFEVDSLESFKPLIEKFFGAPKQA
jgi:hypothetical protein